MKFLLVCILYFISLIWTVNPLLYICYVDKSTRLKKSAVTGWSLVKYTTALEWEDAIFVVFLFHKVLQRHHLGEVGK